MRQTQLRVFDVGLRRTATAPSGRDRRSAGPRSRRQSYHGCHTGRSMRDSLPSMKLRHCAPGPFGAAVHSGRPRRAEPGPITRRPPACSVGMAQQAGELTLRRGSDLRIWGRCGKHCLPATDSLSAGPVPSATTPIARPYGLVQADAVVQQWLLDFAAFVS